MSESHLLIDEDFEAAGTAESWLIHNFKKHLSEEAFDELVRLHSRVGSRRFGMSSGLGIPRHVFELLTSKRDLDLISEGEFRQQWKEALKKPFSADLLYALLDDLDERTVWYAKMLMPIPERYISNHERYLQRVLFEMCRPTSVPDRYIEPIITHLQEQRLLQGHGSVQLKKRVFCCSIDLVEWVIEYVRGVWTSCERIAHQRRNGSRASERIDTSYLFRETFKPGAFVPINLQTYLREDKAVARLGFLSATQACSPPIINQVHMTPRVNNQPNFQTNSSEMDSADLAEHTDEPNSSEPQSSEAGDPKKSNETTSEIKPKLRNWAVGFDGLSWHLFHFRHRRWEHRRKIKFPQGNVHFLMRCLLEQGGAMSQSDARDALKHRYLEADPDSMRKVITQALKKARLAIRTAIADSAKCDSKIVGDPIPNHNPDWRSVIEFGYVSEDDDDGKLKFYRTEVWKRQSSR